MAITAVAAIAGGAAVGAGAVAASTLAMISVGVTAVGMVTKSKTLMKIGGGLGLGSAAAGMLGLGESAVAAVSAESAAANEAAQLQANAAWAQGGAAEAAGVGGAAQEVANASFAQAGASEVASGAGASALEAGAAPEVAAPRGIVGSTVAEPAAAPAAAPASATSAAARPSSGAITGPGGPMSPQPVVDASAVKPTVNAMPTLEPGSSWFDKLGDFWNGLDKSGKLAVGRDASGFVSGVGQGALRYMAASEQRDFEQQQINQRRADRGFVPDLTPYSR